MSYFTQDGTASSCRSDRHGKVPYVMSRTRTMNPQNCRGASGAISFCCAVSVIMWLALVRSVLGVTGSAHASVTYVGVRSNVLDVYWMWGVGGNLGSLRDIDSAIILMHSSCHYFHVIMKRS